MFVSIWLDGDLCHVCHVLFRVCVFSYFFRVAGLERQAGNIEFVLIVLCVVVVVVIAHATVGRP